ncbi:MAG TPA: VOC family protein [Burkholderiaceae bacterium]
MFSHVVVGTNDPRRAKRFYDAVLGVLGYGEGMHWGPGKYVYLSDDSFFIVAQPVDGQPVVPANDSTIGFACSSAEQVDLWHAVGKAKGGKPIEETPGLRETEAGGLYLAYLRDPDGNKLCAVHRMAA